MLSRLSFLRPISNCVELELTHHLFDARMTEDLRILFSIYEYSCFDLVAVYILQQILRKLLPEEVKWRNGNFEQICNADR